ncbi:MAG: hypothetical protein RRZ73_04205 [Oscillospiraceae bacterium]
MPVAGSAVKTLVCVDDWERSVFNGRIYNPFRKNVAKVNDIMEVAYLMEDLFNQLSFPQEYFKHRTFNSAKALPQQKKDLSKEVVRYMDDLDLEKQRGEKATFMIQVQYRQNATWQGTISWVERKESQHFRSTLELIKLMDNAMESMSGEEEPTPTWD